MDFIKFFLFFWWVMIILYKNNIPQKFYNKFKYKLIDKLTNCEFCMESHIGTFLSIGLVFLYSDLNYLFFGFMAAALSNILKR